MAQPFTCFCGTPSCRGRIAGARNMSRDQLAGLWLNGHIWELLHEQHQQQEQQQQQKTARPENGTSSAEATMEAVVPSAIEMALQEELARAEESLRKADEATEAARRALAAHRNGVTTNGKTVSSTNGTAHQHQHHHHHHGPNGTSITNGTNGSARHSTSSRELGGELGGDTN